MDEDNGGGSGEEDMEDEASQHRSGVWERLRGIHPPPYIDHGGARPEL